MLPHTFVHLLTSGSLIPQFHRLSQYVLCKIFLSVQDPVLGHGCVGGFLLKEPHVEALLTRPCARARSPRPRSGSCMLTALLPGRPSEPFPRARLCSLPCVAGALSVPSCPSVGAACPAVQHLPTCLCSLVSTKTPCIRAPASWELFSVKTL